MPLALGSLLNVYDVAVPPCIPPPPYDPNDPPPNADLIWHATLDHGFCDVADDCHVQTTWLSEFLVSLTFFGGSGLCIPAPIVTVHDADDVPVSCGGVVLGNVRVHEQPTPR